MTSAALDGPSSTDARTRTSADEGLGRCGTDEVDALYRRHHLMVYRYCLGIMRDPDTAADVAQSTWMHAMVALSAPHIVVRNAPSWLRGIARNECFDVLRARGALQTLDIGGVELSTGTTTEEAYEMREQLESLVGDLQGLSERQRSAIVLREICGLSSTELADALETTPERASGLVADARQTLMQRRSGRRLDCPDVRRQLLQGRQRSIGLRAHLEVCGPCQSAERHRRGRALSSLALVPWGLVRPLLERWDAFTSVPVAVKGAVAGALIVCSLGASLPLVLSDPPSRAAAAQRSGEATSAATQRASAAERETRRGGARGVAAAGVSGSPSTSPSPTPSSDADLSAAEQARSPAPGAPAPLGPAATRGDTPAPVRDTARAVTDAVRGTLAGSDQTVDETGRALGQTVQETTPTVDAVPRVAADRVERVAEKIDPAPRALD